MKGYTRDTSKETKIQARGKHCENIMNTIQHHSSSRLINAYNQMMATIREVFEDTDPSDITLLKALDIASERAVHLGEITLDEAQEIAGYIKRDINDAAEYMMETSSEFSDWLMLDIEVIERKVIDLFLSVADRTRIELEQLKNHTQELSLYYNNEITGPGTLICNQCGHRVQLVTTTQIKTCPECGNNTFQRKEFKRRSE
jgi:rubrerythrin